MNFQNNGEENGKLNECDICKATFTQRGNLTRHIQAVHDRKQPFSCTKCGRNFAQKVNMLNHKCTGSIDPKIGEISFIGLYTFTCS